MSACSGIDMTGINKHKRDNSEPVDHSVDSIVRDWKIMAVYLFSGLILFLFVVSAPKIAFYATLSLFVFGCMILILSRNG